MMTNENLNAPAESPEPALPSAAERAQYLLWVTERVCGEDFWIAVKEDILEDFASLLNRELPDELWPAAYAQRDAQDYLLAFEAVIEHLKEHCERLASRA